MRIVLFCHSLISDWNHGNAHFVRGVGRELQIQGHDVRVYEPRDSWSATNLLRDAGPEAVTGFREAYPTLSSTRYDDSTLDLDEALDGADVVLVHEWNDPGLIARIGTHHVRSGHYGLFFHDTHHRSVSDPAAIGTFDLSGYDGVLAFGDVIRERYLTAGWGRRAWTWHEAADVRTFRRIDNVQTEGDLVWIGNWGDEERSAEIREYLIRPAREMDISACVYGVRYPLDAQRELRDAGLAYGGWLPNYRVPLVFARHRVTVHIPRRPYVEMLRGIPTIRVFEALACGIPLVSAYWDDREGLFTPGEDYLVARTANEMRTHLRAVLADDELASSLAVRGRETIERRHTCAHRVHELLGIVQTVRGTATEKELTV